MKEQNEQVAADQSYYLIRTYSAGVHFGQIKSRNGKEVTLVNTRRIWYWSGAATLSQMALSGVSKPENCKFSVMLPEIILTEAIEIIPCSVAAQENILGVKEWKM
jgi:hypothetical protein